MEPVLAVVIGVLYAVGLYMMMRRNMVKLIAGLALLGYAANLMIFTISRLTRAQPPLIPEGETLPPMPYADPVPQALILTAIVIGFGLQAFGLVLIRRVYQTLGTDDMDELKTTDK